MQESQQTTAQSGASASMLVNVEHGIRQRDKSPLAVSAVVGSDLENVEVAIERICRSRHGEVQALIDYASQLGGKRLRPILAILCSQIASGESRSKSTLPTSCITDLHRVAASVELVHAASLVHDDVLDQAETRRHRPTVGSRAGNHSAILLGDYLFTKAYEMASRCRDSYPARRLARAASMLCEGELRQQRTMGRWDTSVSTYLEVLAQKTARYRRQLSAGGLVGSVVCDWSGKTTCSLWHATWVSLSAI